MANSNKTPLENDNSLSSESIFEKTTPPKLTNINKMYKFYLICSSVCLILSYSAVSMFSKGTSENIC